MLSEKSKAVAENAKRLYESRLREELEPEHAGKYVAIEPVSGSHFIGDTFDAAVNAAIEAFPGRVTFTLRIGYPAAFHMGVLGS